MDALSSRPDAMILCYPVITFGDYRHNGSMVNLLGEAPGEELRYSLSNENSVSTETPPTFLWHTAEDQAVPVENSLLFSNSLSKSKVSFELHIFPYGRHGLGLAQDTPGASAWPTLCENWLRNIKFI